MEGVFVTIFMGTVKKLASCSRLDVKMGNSFRRWLFVGLPIFARRMFR
jgi:hypothetical protein